MNEHDMGWHRNKVTVKCNLPQSKNKHKHQNKYKIVLKKNACKSNRIQWKKRQNFLLKTTNLIKIFNYIIQFNLQ